MLEGLRLVKFLEGRDTGLFQTALDSSVGEDLRLLRANSQTPRQREETRNTAAELACLPWRVVGKECGGGETGAERWDPTTASRY